MSFIPPVDLCIRVLFTFVYRMPHQLTRHNKTGLVNICVSWKQILLSRYWNPSALIHAVCVISWTWMDNGHLPGIHIGQTTLCLKTNLNAHLEKNAREVTSELECTVKRQRDQSPEPDWCQDWGCTGGAHCKITKLTEQFSHCDILVLRKICWTKRK